MESIACVGIDASKDRLEVLVDRPNNRRLGFANDARGVARLVRELGDGRYVVAIEATGRYESLARHALEAAGHDVRLQNPRQVRRLAEGLGVQAKTDGLDAEVLARTAELCAPNEPRSAVREALGDLSRTIDALKVDRAGHLKRVQVPGFSKVAAAALRRVVAALDRQIRNLEAEFVRQVGASPLAERYRLVLGVPNVGPCLARIAVCELPENLESWSIRQLSSYAGLPPMNKSSGKKELPARVPKHKNAHLKAGLYMPAMVAVQRSPWATKTYARLRARGLVHQSAVVAVMHKLLFHIVAVLKRGSAWEAEPPKKS